MEKDFYDIKESKHSKLINDLKNLPQENTPDNFEYNLMVRIQNRDFERVNALPEKKRKAWYLLPAFSLGLTAIIIFFIFQPESSDINPLMIDPPAITSNSAAALPSDPNLHRTENDAVLKESEKHQAAVPGKIASAPVVANNNDAVVPQKPPYPLFRRNNVSIDDYLSGNKSNRNNLDTRGSLVSSGDSDFDFEGFLVPQNPDPKLIQRYRAIVDSIKKARAKEDSIRIKLNNSNSK